MKNSVWMDSVKPRQGRKTKLKRKFMTNQQLAKLVEMFQDQNAHSDIMNLWTIRQQLVEIVEANTAKSERVRPLSDTMNKLCDNILYNPKAEHFFMPRRTKKKHAR